MMFNKLLKLAAVTFLSSVVMMGTAFADDRFDNVLIYFPNLDGTMDTEDTASAVLLEDIPSLDYLYHENSVLKHFAVAATRIRDRYILFVGDINTDINAPPDDGIWTDFDMHINAFVFDNDGDLLSNFTSICIVKSRNDNLENGCEIIQEGQIFIFGRIRQTPEGSELKRTAFEFKEDDFHYLGNN